MSNAYRFAMCCYLSLVGLILLWHAWLSPPRPEMISLTLLLHAGPLLLPLRGLLHARRYTFKWSGMLIMAYFIHGVAAAANAGAQRPLGILEIVLSLGFFLGALRFLRLSRPVAAQP
jgi:uncharacterized membrane protein